MAAPVFLKRRWSGGDERIACSPRLGRPGLHCKRGEKETTIFFWGTRPPTSFKNSRVVLCAVCFCRLDGRKGCELLRSSSKVEGVAQRHCLEWSSEGLTISWPSSKRTLGVCFKGIGTPWQRLLSAQRRQIHGALGAGWFLARPWSLAGHSFSDPAPIRMWPRGTLQEANKGIKQATKNAGFPSGSPVKPPRNAPWFVVLTSTNWLEFSGL